MSDIVHDCPPDGSVHENSADCPCRPERVSASEWKHRSSPEAGTPTGVEEAWDFALRAYRTARLTLGEAQALELALAAAVPLLGLAAQADTDRDAARRALDAELVRRTVAAEAERDALRVQRDQAQAALAAVKKLAAEWSSDVEVDEWNPLAELRAALGVQS